MGKALRRKNADQAVLQSKFEDLQNEFDVFKKQMANVCWKYDKNFREVEASERITHRGWIAHEATIDLINERCRCGKDNEEEEDFQSLGSTISSPLPIGTPVLLQVVPLQVMPSFQIGWVTRLSFGEASDSFIIDAPSPGRNPSSLQPRSFCGTWLPEGSTLVSSGS